MQTRRCAKIHALHNRHVHPMPRRHGRCITSLRAALLGCPGGQVVQPLGEPVKCILDCLLNARDGLSQGYDLYILGATPLEFHAPMLQLICESFLTGKRTDAVRFVRKCSALGWGAGRIRDVCR